MKYLALALLLIVPPSIAAADPTPAPIIIPDGPTPPSPPPPTPSTTLKLSSDQLMVVRANIDVVVLTSPAGLVKVTKDAGPVKIKAKFSDGNGTYECKTFTDKWVYSLEATGSGTAELLVVNPADGSVVRRTLELNGPTPPPPPPLPPNPTDPLVAALQAAYAADADPQKAVKLADLASLFGALIAVEKSTGTVTTLAQLNKEIHARTDAVAGAGGMPALRKAIGVYLNTKLPTTDTAMTDALWATASSAYADITKALGNVKGK